MKANQSDDACSGPHSSELPSKAELNRAASKLGVYEWENLAYTEAADLAKAVRKPALTGLMKRLKTLLRRTVL